MAEESLYSRLGGEKKIREVVTTIFENHLANKAINKRYAESDRDKVIATVTAFVCAGTGGPQAYTGKDMLAAHKGMNISEAEYMAVLDDMEAAFDQHKLGAKEKAEMMMIALSLRGDILHR